MRNLSDSSLSFPAEKILWEDAGSLENIDAVIHLAGESIGERRWSAAQKKKIQNSRTQTSHKLRKIVQGIRGRQPKVLLSASAVGFYGDRGSENLSEASDPGSGFLAETCVAWEAAVGEMKKEIPRIVFLRTGVVLGRAGGALQQILPLFKFGVGGRLGSGEQWMSWIHLDDIVGLYLHALENETIDGPLNGVAPNPVTNAEFTRILGQALNVNPFFPAPKIALKIGLGEMSSLLLDSQRVHSQLNSYEFRYTKLGDALASIVKEVERARGIRAHDFESRQWLPISPEQIFAYLAASESVANLAPPNLHLVPKSSIRLQEGAVYEYSFQSLGCRFECRSQVVSLVENHRFTTTHQKGPFSFWLHERKFERLAGGTLVADFLVYRHRFGFFGDLFSHRASQAKLREIFQFRRQALSSLFGTAGNR